MSLLYFVRLICGAFALQANDTNEFGVNTAFLTVKLLFITETGALNVEFPDAINVVVAIPPLNVSKAVAVSGVVFCKYLALACEIDMPEPDDVCLKYSLSYMIPKK